MSTDRIRHLNDLARTKSETVNATWIITTGVQHLLAGNEDGPATPERFAALRHAVASFDDWSSDNDPHGEHDFGAFSLFGERLFFKMDYYHPERDMLAPDPGNIELCRRVLTMLLASEY